MVNACDILVLTSSGAAMSIYYYTLYIATRYGLFCQMVATCLTFLLCLCWLNCLEQGMQQITAQSTSSRWRESGSSLQLFWLL